MLDDSVLRSIERLCELPQGSLSRETTLTSIAGWDSLRVVEFVAMLDSDYGVTLDFEKISGRDTVGDLADLVQNARSNRGV